ncbi:MAG: hypothetical protein RL129_100 [Actinomycetota bacterium]|jgi:pyruvate dehydrogenase E1 component alpha subunit
MLENTKSEYLKIYRDLVSIRLTEEVIADHYPKGEMRTPTHLGIGQEAVALGVLDLKINGDTVFSHHRSHNHYLASGGDRRKLFAELLGRKTGCSGGKGGSVHLVARDKGFYGSSAILGQSIALATGSAFAMKMKMQNNVSIAFFGDAALEEGTLWESLNFASLNKVPVLFVCENNLYSTESGLQKRISVDSDFASRAKAFGAKYVRGNGNNYFSVKSAAKSAINSMRENPGPYFLEFETYRWREHVGPFFDHDLNRDYRTLEEFQLWASLCPIDHMSRLIQSKFPDSKMELDQIYESQKTLILEELEMARLEPWPEMNDLYSNVYWEGK